MKHRISICLLFLFALLGAAHAAEYFVRVDGSDENDGLSREAAFATFQRGVDALQPGDTLTIGPGEYSESVSRTNLGSMDAVTTIRAEIPGAAILRGDVPVSGFRKLDGHRLVYVADFDHDAEVLAVNELDTLTVFQARPSVSEVDFTPGTFRHDREQGKLYVSTSDNRPAEAHLYTASVIRASGLYLSDPARVHVEGIGATGFNTAAIDQAGRGIFMTNAHECVVRDCHAWLNGWGVEIESSAPGSGGNVIEHSTAWANNAPYVNWRRGGLNIHRHRGDVIRDSTAFLNAYVGTYLRSGSDPENPSRLVNNLTWGNRWDCVVKGNSGLVHVTERSVGGAYSTWSENPARNNPEHCLVLTGTRPSGASASNIWLQHEQGIDIHREFADPDNHDYRLQATSRFRGTGPDGVDRGPFPYEANVFFVALDGDDAADGLSVVNAWRTVSRGLRDLRPGDTLYISPGTYREDIEAQVQGVQGDLVSIRGRGRDAVILDGDLHLSGSRHAEFKRIRFDGAVRVSGSADIAYDNCRFAGAGTALEADGVAGLRVTHCAFSGFEQAAISLSGSEDAHLRGNLYDNGGRLAVRADSLDAVRYTDYNAYRDAGAAWEAGGRALALGDLPDGHGRYSVALPEEFAANPAVASLHHRHPVAATGPMGMPFGPYRGEPRRVRLRLTSEPVVHSVSATTANIEWMTSLPAGCLIAWGETPECENTLWFDVNYFGTYSLTGLEPGKTYYFKVAALRAPSTFRQVIGIGDEPETAIRLTGDPIEFATLRAEPPPQVYHVAPDGDDANDGMSRDNAWRTIGHAASQVKAGDTVLVGEGVYEETVRVRATGAPNAPITFKNAPGERVVMAGAGESLTQGFIAGGKRHLRFDGFTFRDYNMFSGTPHAPFGWHLIRAAEFNLYRSGDVRISRCMSDGRGGYSATFLNAFLVDDLAVENSVFMNKMGGALSVSRCPNAQIRHNVFLRPMISSFQLNNAAGQDAVFHNNIFCGMLEKKANLNVSYAEIEDISTLKLKDNAFLLRCFPPEERIVFQAVDHAQRRVTASYTVPKFDAEIGDTGSVLADPEFAGVLRAAEAGEQKPEYPPEMLLRPGREIDFSSFFATHPEMVERGIGLQPEAFEDFGFRAPD